MAEALRGEAKVRLSRLVGWGVLGQLAYVIGQFLLLVALARHASVEDVGRFGLASAITLPIFWFFNLGIRANQATDTTGQYRFHEYMRLRLYATALTYVLVVVIALCLSDPAMLPVMLIFGATKGVETWSDLCYGSFQRGDRLWAVAQSLILRGFAGSLLFWIIIATTGTVILAYLGLLLAWTAVAFGLDVPRARRIARAEGDVKPVRLEVVRELALGSLPLAFNALLAALQGSSPRYVTGHMLGIAALGQFTLIGYAMQAVTTIVTAVGQSIIARLAHYAANGNRRAFTRILTRFMGLIAVAATVAAILALLIGDPVLTLIFGPDYSGLAGLLALIMVASGMVASAGILQSGLLATRRFTHNLRIRVVSFTLVLVLSAIGAHFWGLTGVVGGMIISSAVQTLLLGWTLTRMSFIAPPIP